MLERPLLHALAERIGILSDYEDIDGERRFTSDETRVALLSAMRIDASSERAAGEALRRMEERKAAEPLPATVVVRRSRLGRDGLRIPMPVDVASGRLDFSLIEEDGSERHGAGAIRGGRGRITLHVPLDGQTAIGYHRLQLNLPTDGGPREAACGVIVCPDRCWTVEEAIDGERRYGIWTQLYGLRSARDWGVGDVASLRELTDWAAAEGASFIGINPIHSLRNRGHDISPYSPVSRLFHNTLYISVDEMPELAECPSAHELIGSEPMRERMSEARAADRVDFDAVIELKEKTWAALHRAFTDRHRGTDSERERAYEAYLKDAGPLLTDFATFSALDRRFREDGIDDWRAWPREFRDPSSSAVSDFRDANSQEIDRYRFLQFELDRQLAGAARHATTSGVPLGIYGDLAIGSAPNGFDTWAFPDLFVTAANIGAPPDDYSLTGQDWGLPPLDPRRLAAEGYRYWILLIRAALGHLGALRIDHVMGLFRQFWVPQGGPATEGAYLRYPAADLLGILALESRRHEAVIVGEDLGTVPRGVPATLARWGILSSGVLYFKRDRRGRFLGPGRYSKRALVTASTHDHPPLAGFWTGRDLELRRRVGDIPSDEELEKARRSRSTERRALADRLARQGCLAIRDRSDEGIDNISLDELCAAVYRFLGHTPAPLVGVRLADLARDLEPVNLPGVSIESYPSWSWRLPRTLRELKDDPLAEHTLAGLEDRRRAST